jgi:hypothetical protein
MTRRVNKAGALMTPQRKMVLVAAALLAGMLALLIPVWTVMRSPAVLRAIAKANAQRRPAASTTPAMADRDPRLAGAYRFEDGGWVYVHLEGAPERVGFQHGYLLAPEIADAFAEVKLSYKHSTQRDWGFFRKAAREVLWPRTDIEYQQEMSGILEGLRARGVAMDLEDVVALNGMEELPDYYVPWFNAHEHVAHAPRLTSPGNCSAFVATGSYTVDHRPVIAHNNWTSYLQGERWHIIFDIAPERGYHILMDGFPGVIASDDDFGINSQGIAVTETTISQFHGYDPKGVPEFVRARKAQQYATSIDDYVQIMLDGNNGGYANDWLLADYKTGEIAQFELGLKIHRLWRTQDGYFVGSNFATDPTLIKQETTFDPNDPASSPNARRLRWEQLMKAAKGQIDVEMAKKFESDHGDSYLKKQQPGGRSLCGHADKSATGVPIWDWGPYYPGGAVQGKAMDSAMAGHMSFAARSGHPCGDDFIAAPFLKAHPEYSWMSPLLRDMKAGPWTVVKSGERH